LPTRQWSYWGVPRQARSLRAATDGRQRREEDGLVGLARFTARALAGVAALALVALSLLAVL